HSTAPHSIYTLSLHDALPILNDREPRAEAVAVRRDRFLAVGSNSDVLNLATAATSKIDLGGKTVTPGFIDAHSHPAEAGLMHLRSEEHTSELQSRSDLVCRLL